MRVAFKPFGGINTASSRLRVKLPIEYLNRSGADIQCEVFDAAHPEKYSIVVFQKTYSPEDIQLAASLKSKGVKVFFDLCDNHFFNPNDSKELAARAELLKKMVSASDEIVVSNEILGELTNRPYTVIDDMMENSIHTWIAKKIFRPLARLVRGRRVKLVWFGNSGSEAPRFGMIDLEGIIPELNELNKSVKIELSVISNDRSMYERYVTSAEFPTRYYQWTRATFPYIMQLNDITIIPIDVNPFTVCKTNNRPLLSLVLGLPVVATKIPSYESLSDYMLFDDWKENLRVYATDRALVREHTKEGFDFIVKNFNNRVITNQWIDLFEKHRN